MQKVVVVGVDGATPDLLEEWVKKDELPVFKKLMSQGVWGKLRSTVPPFSAPAWASIVTGFNPGGHGIYGFEKLTDLQTHLITSHDRRKKALWNYFTEINLRNIIVNIPGTFPPEEIKGFMITGLLTPSMNSDFTYPKSLKKRLTDDDLGRYELESIWLEDFPRSHMARNKPEKLLEVLFKQMESRVRVTVNLMKNTPWDFTMVVIRGTDTAQHFLMHRKDLVLRCYKKVDELIGEIINTAPEATFFIVSDHGFQLIKKILHPDNVLYKNGFLTPMNEPGKKLAVSSFFYKISRFILEILPPSVLKKSGFIKKTLFSAASKEKTFDFSKTQAFCTSEGRGIQINLKNR